MKVKILFILFALLLFSCQLDKEQLGTSLEPLTKVQAMEVAQNEVKDIASSQTAQVWNSNSRVTDAYEVYLDGIEGVSYYECKVTTDGKDSGYVLVNVNGTDFTVVEACETGVTLNESYADSTGLAIGDFDVFRYGYFESVAYASEEDGAVLSSASGKKERKVVAANGLDVNNYDFDAFQKVVKENNGSPYSTVSYEKESKLAARATTGKDTVEEKYLAPGFKKGLFLGNALTPSWSQFIINGKTFEPNCSSSSAYPNRYIGCGPIAWAITLAYWQEQLGKNNLFSTSVLSASVINFFDNFAKYSNIYYDIVKMDNFLETSRAAGYGYTPIHKMHFIEKYINSKGYSCSVVHDNGTYDPKFNKIYDAISSNKPVVMGINGDGIGAIDHYIVIEGAKRHSEPGKSYIWYFCNMGGSRRYVYAYSQVNIPLKKDGVRAGRYSTYSIWILTIN